MGLKIKRGDTVVVLSGKEKGKRGEVERVLPRQNRVVVGGVNVRTRHARPTQNKQQGLYTFGKRGANQGRVPVHGLGGEIPGRQGIRGGLRWLG